MKTAKKLIAALKQSSGEDETPKKEPKGKSKYSMLRIRIDAKDPNKKEEEAKVTVNVPLTLARKAAGLLSLVPKDTKKDLNEKGIDLDSIDLKELIDLFELGELDEELVNIKVGGRRGRSYGEDLC